MKRTAITITLVCALVVVFVYSQRDGTAARDRAQADQARENCEAINEVKAALVKYIGAQLDRSARSLPTIDYYRNHPVELGKALANLQQQREETAVAFAEKEC